MNGKIDSGALDGDEIVVTEAMVEAGLEHFSADDDRFDDERHIIKDIF